MSYDEHMQHRAGVSEPEPPYQPSSPQAARCYLRFLGHCENCDHCYRAGGEWAKEKDLCPTGRELARTWGKAEAREAEDELI